MKILQSFLPLSFLSLLLLALPSPSHQVPNPRLQNAFIALQAWKKAMTSDPLNFTSNWHGPHVCSYNGVFCAPAPDDGYVMTVAGVDLNHANIAGTLPKELGLLTDLALFHLNSNRFSGSIPHTFKKWTRIFEFDISNNKFYGEFPNVLLYLPSLKFLDLRYNYFEGPLPSALFDLKLDALFLNNNNFKSKFPKNIGNSPVSVAVLAHNNLPGCIPPTISKMSKTLNELILIDVGLKACLPQELGKLTNVTVFDVSYNGLSGQLPATMGNMKSLEQLNVAHNMLTGYIPGSICRLPKLQNFTYSFNFYTGEPVKCLKLKSKDDRFNCIPNRPAQRPPKQCKAVTAYPVSCSTGTC
ncbi:hypothetical protein Cgig2_004433 [Carnegiea gigantea]|uniref:Cell wall hydroxyproline-rich glycoprotein n=1 Tax=Carnegiea gigantea TaxID=171969 RepID=A0A9Q1Q7V0_9CARY|nr:hypothetical protein Cgig2_004433 [Carnegiea gigantea]